MTYKSNMINRKILDTPLTRLWIPLRTALKHLHLKGWWKVFGFMMLYDWVRHVNPLKADTALWSHARNWWLSIDSHRGRHWNSWGRVRWTYFNAWRGLINILLISKGPRVVIFSFYILLYVLVRIFKACGAVWSDAGNRWISPDSNRGWSNQIQQQPKDPQSVGLKWLNLKNPSIILGCSSPWRIV